MRRSAGVLAAALALVVPVRAAAQDTEWNRYTLDGLGGVFISAEASAACADAGVTASSIQADAAVQLLEADVPLLTEDEMLANVGLPELHVTLECAAGEGNGTSHALGYSVSVRVEQAAQMIRDEQVTLSEAVTWYTTAVGVVDTSGAVAAIKAAVQSKLAEFAEAYVAANKEEGGGG